MSHRNDTRTRIKTVAHCQIESCSKSASVTSMLSWVTASTLSPLRQIFHCGLALRFPRVVRRMPPRPPIFFWLTRLSFPPRARVYFWPESANIQDRQGGAAASAKPVPLVACYRRSSPAQTPMGLHGISGKFFRDCTAGKTPQHKILIVFIPMPDVRHLDAALIVKLGPLWVISYSAPASNCPAARQPH